MKKLISTYNQAMNWAKNHKLLKYFTVPGLIAEAWYNTKVYGILAAPIVLLKRRNVHSRLPFGEISVALSIALFGVIPPFLWRDWFVFALFWAISMMFILKTADVCAAANYSIYMYIFILAAFFLPTSTTAGTLVLYLLAIIGISFLIMHVIDEPQDIFKVLAGVYAAVVARSILVAIDTILAANLHSGANFSEFLIMLFPFALAFAFLKRCKRWRWWLLLGLLPSIYGVVAVLLDIGNILQQQNFLIPQFDGDVWNYALEMQGIYARAGTVGTQPFVEIYQMFMNAQYSDNLGVGLLLYLGLAAILLFLWYVIRLVRRAIFGIFKKSGDARIVLIAGIVALLGVVIVAPLSVDWLSIRTLFLYWIVIGILGGIVRNRVTG